MRAVRGLDHIDVHVSDEGILELVQHDSSGTDSMIYLPVEYVGLLIDAINAEIAETKK